MDLLIRRGRVLTMAGEVLEGGSLAVAGQRIAAVGPDPEIAAAYRADCEVDATGRAVLPGLVNTHSHAPMTLFRGLADDRELMDWLQNYVFPAEARMVNREFVRLGTQLACLEMIRGGITTFADMYYFEDIVAEESARAGMRGVLGQALIDFPAPDNKTWDEAVGAVRRFAEAYRGHPLITPAVAPHAPYTVSQAHLGECRALADELGLPLIIHLAETRAEVETIYREHRESPTAYLSRIGFLGPRTLTAHTVWADDPDLELLKRHGTGIAHCPQSNMKLASGVAPVVRMLKAGLAVGLGTDGAASNNDLDLWQEMQSASFLQKVSLLDPTALPARQVLEMATALGARALSMGDETGTLEVGKRADVIVVDLDGPHQTPLYDLASALAYTTRAGDVRTAVVDGRVIMRDREVLTLDEASIRAQALETAERIRREVL
ncbi:MAG: amidohydrolase [Candidatus Eremiobacterota bacterium]